MARREVFEVTCDRCKKVETQSKENSTKTEDGDDSKELVLKFKGKTLEYVDLCMRCRRSVGGYVDHISGTNKSSGKKENNKMVSKRDLSIPGKLTRVAG